MIHFYDFDLFYVYHIFIIVCSLPDRNKQTNKNTKNAYHSSRFISFHIKHSTEGFVVNNRAFLTWTSAHWHLRNAKLTKCSWAALWFGVTSVRVGYAREFKKNQTKLKLPYDTGHWLQMKLTKQTSKQKHSYWPRFVFSGSEIVKK